MTDYYISITNKCNLNCSYCYERKLNTQYGMIDDSTADRIIGFINDCGTAGMIHFFGGEPLLGKNIIKKLRSEIKACSYFITTNGTLLDEEFIKWCAQNSVKINISHDGRDCSSRGVTAEKISEKIKLLQKYQRDTLVQLVYTEDNLLSLPENIKYFRDMGIRNVSATLEESTAPSDTDKFGDLLHDAWQKAAEISGIDILELSDKIRRICDGSQKKCEICQKKMYINWDGKIYPCLQFQNRVDFCCGNVYDGLDSSAVEKKYPEYSEYPKDCSDCEIMMYCDNLCACRKMASSGTLHSVSEAFCLEQQILTLTALERIKKRIQ